MAEVIDLTRDRVDEEFMGSFTLSGYVDKTTGIVRVNATFKVADDPVHYVARSYLYPEDSRQLMDSFESGDRETSAKILKAVANDLARQLGFEIF